MNLAAMKQLKSLWNGCQMVRSYGNGLLELYEMDDAEYALIGMGTLVGTAREAVERFHPNWLRGRAGTVRTETGRSYPHVFVDGRPFGTAESLHQFGTESIEEIRFISPADATTRYGTGYTGGIIEVILKRSLAS